MSTSSISDVLNKLPLISGTLFTPYSNVLSDCIIRLAFREEGKPTHIPIETLQYGSTCLEYQPQMFFSGKPCDTHTIRKHRQHLIDMGLLKYSVVPIKDTPKSYGSYTLDNEAISDLVSREYLKLKESGVFNNVVDPTCVMSTQIRTTNRQRLIASYRQFMKHWVDYKLSVIECCCYKAFISLAIAVKSVRLVNLVSKMYVLLPSVSNRQVRRVLHRLEQVGLIIVDYLSNGRPVHIVNMTEDIRTASLSRLVHI